MAGEHEFVVVGAGLLGLAAARALATRGRDVVLLDQAEPGHQAAGSKGSCRIFRLGYGDPGYVAAARRARELWRDLEADYGSPLLFAVPQLSFGPQLGSVHAAMRQAGAPCELLPAVQAAERFPGVAIGGPVLLEPESGVIAADDALRAMAAAVPDIRTAVRVRGLADDGRRVCVHTEAGPLSARTVIVCAGPWTGGLLAGSGMSVPSAPTLEQVAYLAPAAAPQPDMPIFISHARQAPYGLPVPGSGLYKIGIHRSGPPVDPDLQPQRPDPRLIGRISRLARELLPGLDPEPAMTERCVYDNSPDEDFIVDRAGNVVLGCGTSGHGFKFGPLLGEWLAGLAGGGPEQRPPARFALGRFSPASAGTAIPCRRSAAD